MTSPSLRKEIMYIIHFIVECNSTPRPTIKNGRPQKCQQNVLAKNHFAPEWQLQDY